MHDTPAETQVEGRSERVALAVTPSEKRAVRALAAFRGSDESNLLRSMTLDQIVAEFERVRAAVPAAGEAA